MNGDARDPLPIRLANAVIQLLLSCACSFCGSSLRTSYMSAAFCCPAHSTFGIS